MVYTLDRKPIISHKNPGGRLQVTAVEGECGRTKYSTTLFYETQPEISLHLKLKREFLSFPSSAQDSQFAEAHYDLARAYEESGEADRAHQA